MIGILLSPGISHSAIVPVPLSWGFLVSTRESRNDVSPNTKKLIANPTIT